MSLLARVTVAWARIAMTLLKSAGPVPPASEDVPQPTSVKATKMVCSAGSCGMVMDISDASVAEVITVTIIVSA